MAIKEKDFSVTTIFETKTGGGQFVEIRCRPDDRKEIEALLEKIESVHIPVTNDIKLVSHGGYGAYSRFNATQHKYAGGGCGYIECIEIKDAPEGRCGNIVHEYESGYSVFYEFATIEQAIEAWEKFWKRSIMDDIVKMPGFLKKVSCGWFSPWFYAVADQALYGDFAFPRTVGIDHPIYRPFNKFIVKKYGEPPKIKTCIAYTEEKTSSDYGRGSYISHTVYWDDGTSSSFSSPEDAPILLGKDQIWIWDAKEKFARMLAGCNMNFSIDFIDGSKFTGRLRPKEKGHHNKGYYNVKFTTKDGRKGNAEGYFEPSETAPTVEAYMKLAALKKGDEIKSIDSCFRKGKGEGTWLGVYPRPQKEENFCETCKRYHPADAACPIVEQS